MLSCDFLTFLAEKNTCYLIPIKKFTYGISSLSCKNYSQHIKQTLTMYSSALGELVCRSNLFSQHNHFMEFLYVHFNS